MTYRHSFRKQVYRCYFFLYHWGGAPLLWWSPSWSRWLVSLGDVFESHLSLNRSTVGWGGGMQRGPPSIFSKSDSFWQYLCNIAAWWLVRPWRKAQCGNKTPWCFPARAQFSIPQHVPSIVRTWLYLCFWTLGWHSGPRGEPIQEAGSPGGSRRLKTSTSLGNTGHELINWMNLHLPGKHGAWAHQLDDWVESPAPKMMIESYHRAHATCPALF